MTRYFETTGNQLLDTELHFCSGANRPAEIRALVATGNNVGIAVNEIGEAGLQVIEESRGNYWQRFFVDSGAFSEVTFGANGPQITRPISDAEWTKRLARYDRLAVSMGKQVYLVAPDCVAHQDETLARLAKYSAQIVGWMVEGANVIVPVQKGKLSMPEFTRAVARILGAAAQLVIWGVPMKKDATSVDELRAFVAAVKPARMHLLGIGPKSKGYRAAVAAVVGESPDCEVYSDSVRITALVGRNNGPGGGPRPITKYLAEGKGPEYAVRRAMMDELSHDVAEAEADGWIDEPKDAKRSAMRLASGQQMQFCLAVA
jgi:hypothetical protein